MPRGEKSRLLPVLSRTERKGCLPEETASAAPFDWRAYLENHPDLEQSGIDTEDKAWEHYQSIGYREHRITSRVRTVIRYLACDGLMNQLYSHISALAIAKSMRADVVLPPAAQRSSFGDSNTIEAGAQATVRWEPAPLEGLLDVEFLMDYWQRRGMNISQPPKDLPVPTLRHHEAASWDDIPLPGIDPVLRFRGLSTLPSRRSVELADVVAALRREMAEHISAVVSEHPHRTIDTILIDLPHLLFLITTERVMPLVTEIARTLQFAPRLVRLAEAVLEGMRLQYGTLYFNGLHLRIEEDAVDWITVLGGRDGVWKRYEKAMQASGSFSQTTAVYVASGLLTYDSGSKFNEYSRKLQKKQLAKQVFVKEMFLQPSDLDPLTSEEKAAVDFMVLVKSAHFVGIHISTFSYYVREYRSLDGIDTATTTFIDTSEFGPNALFEISARVI